MGEKRFKKGINLSCVDTETGKSYWYACNLCGLLNEQQEHITHLEDTNDNFRIKLIEDIEVMEQAEKKIGDQQSTIESLKKDLKTVIDSYDCERIGYCHKGEYCKKWGLNNDR